MKILRKILGRAPAQESIEEQIESLHAKSQSSIEAILQDDAEINGQLRTAALKHCEYGEVLLAVATGGKSGVAMTKAVNDQGKRETFQGYGPDQGYPWLREAIVEHEFKSRGCDVSSSLGAASTSLSLGDK